MNKQDVEPKPSLRAQHEAKAIANMREAIRLIETAIQDASHGNYRDAMRAAHTARDGLYFTEFELRKAEVAALRKS